MVSFAAIIPARSGSKSIIDKNLLPLGGHPLLAYSIALAKTTSGIDRVIVSTDSEDYAQIAVKYGAEVPFLRPSELSQDSSTDYDFVAHAISWFDEHDDRTPDYWVHLRPTTPLREAAVVGQALTLISCRTDASALRSGHISPESPFKWLRKNADGFLTDLTGTDTNLDKYNDPRQTFPKVLVPNGYVDIVKTSFVKEKGCLHGDKVLAFETPLCSEVDVIDEVEFLEFQLQKKGSTLSEYLEESL